MMLVSPEVKETAQYIIDQFDPQSVKDNMIESIEKEKPSQDQIINDKSDARWDRIVKMSEAEDAIEEVKNKDFQKEGQQYLEKMMGCNQDHSKEIDLYNKTFDEKIDRVKTLKQQGNDAFKEDDLQKAAYYYAQALLVFYYLIPDNDEETRISDELKNQCHSNQAMVFLKQKRYDEAMRETDSSLQLQPTNQKSLYRKAQIYLALQKYTKALKVVNEKLLIDCEKENKTYLKLKQQIQQELTEYEAQQKVLYNKMVNKNSTNEESKEQENQKVEVQEEKEEEEKVQELQEEKQEEVQSQKVEEQEVKPSPPEPKAVQQQEQDQNQPIIKPTEPQLQNNDEKLKEEISFLKQQLKSMSEQVHEQKMCIEMFKQYGFQPKQFDQLMEEFRRAYDPDKTKTTSAMESEKFDEMERKIDNLEYRLNGMGKQYKDTVTKQRSEINEVKQARIMDKLQMAFIMVLVSVLSAYLTINYSV